MDLVRDSVSAQSRTGPKPMFVNNYFVGDNNWRTAARGTPDTVRQPDDSKNRSSIAVDGSFPFGGRGQASMVRANGYFENESHGQ